MSIHNYNGGTAVAMAGKECVAIACDKRLGEKFQTFATNFNKIFEMGPHLYIGIAGLATDVLTLSQRLKFRTNLFELRENRRVTPKIFSSIVSNVLYEKRFGPYFINPVIAGLEPNTLKPYISSMDSIGCVCDEEKFACVGTATNELYGMCEALWEPDMNPDELFECISQALTNAFDRNAASGWGAYVYVIEKDKVTVRELKTRMD